jgi:trans-2,3-dihydro-3-hydroxyanthranilate isomerase
VRHRSIHFSTRLKNVLADFRIACLICGLVACVAAPPVKFDEAPARTYRYDQWDVFTDEVLTGNQLAVFMDPVGLTDNLMQKIAREMAFSETTFVFPAETAGTDFRIRIFGPNREMPFAGHPTIGTAFALSQQGRISPGTRQVIFGEGIGPVAVDLEWEDERLIFAWMQQLSPTFGKPIEDLDGVADALGVAPFQLRSTKLPVQEVSCGSPFIFVPLASRAAVDQAKVNSISMASVVKQAGVPQHSIFIFSLESAEDGATVYSRMVGFGDREDPATGSASGPLGAYLVHHGAVSPDEADSIVSRQGVQMGRPSSIHIRIGTRGEEISEVLVGGSSVFIGEGTIILPAD